ncbi:MAG: DUF362 domain-containing protein [Planctomycetes bacterium]|nr:DUF362 domain-containing protein [Planctomycetota bacterium]
MLEKEGRSAVARREFLKRTALGTAGAVMAGELPAWGQAEAKSLVVVVKSDSAISEENPDRANLAVVEKMLERGVCELTGKSDAKAAWTTFFRPSDAVATCDAGSHLQNVPELSVAVMKGLALAGVRQMKLGSIWVAYRERSQMKERLDGWIAAVKEGLAAAKISEEVMDRELYRIPARFAVDPFDGIVLVCTLKPHYLCGVAGAVKHFATLAKKGPRVYHPDGMKTAGEVLATDFKAHRKLVVVDALRFAGTGDPHRPARDYVFQKSLVLSADPVAADAVALDLFLKAGCKPSGDIPPQIHIEAADKDYHAGVSDLAKIDVRQVKV